MSKDDESSHGETASEYEAILKSLDRGWSPMEKSKKPYAGDQLELSRKWGVPVLTGYEICDPELVPELDWVLMDLYGIRRRIKEGLSVGPTQSAQFERDGVAKKLAYKNISLIEQLQRVGEKSDNPISYCFYKRIKNSNSPLEADTWWDTRDNSLKEHSNFTYYSTGAINIDPSALTATYFKRNRKKDFSNSSGIPSIPLPLP